MPNYKLKVCFKCGEEFMPTNNCQKYCEECGIIERKEKKIEADNRYSSNHKEQRNQSSEQWRLEHPEKVKQQHKQYYSEHKEQVKQSTKQWRKAHSEEIKELWIKHFDKRNRNLDFIPLTKAKEGYVAHHLDKNYVIYMPEEIHKSIPHSVLRNINMDEINAVA
jgi:hypothetical protein